MFTEQDYGQLLEFYSPFDQETFKELLGQRSFKLGGAGVELNAKVEARRRVAGGIQIIGEDCEPSYDLEGHHNFIDYLAAKAAEGEDAFKTAATQLISAMEISYIKCGETAVKPLMDFVLRHNPAVDKSVFNALFERHAGAQRTAEQIALDEYHSNRFYFDKLARMRETLGLGECGFPWPALPETVSSALVKERRKNAGHLTLVSDRS